MMLWTKTGIVAHDDSKGNTIKQGPYSLEDLSLPQGHLIEYLLQGLDVYQIS